MTELSSAISIISFGVAIFLAVLLFLAGPPRRDRRLLAAVLGIHALVFLLRYLLQAESPLIVSLPFVAFPLAASQGPLLYLYSRAVLFPDAEPPSRAGLWFFVPAPALFIIHAVLFVLVPEFRSVAHIVAHSGIVGDYTRALLVFFSIYGTGFIVAALWSARAALRLYKDRYAGDYRSRLMWLRALLIFHAGIYAANLLLVLGTLFLPVQFPVTPVEGFIALLLTYFVLYYIIRRPETFALKEAAPEAPASQAPSGQKYSRQSLPADERRKILDRLRLHMDSERPYLDEHISLAGLSRQLGVPAHHLSMVINSELGCNFYRFINSYRLQEARRLLRDPDASALSILRIAYQAGFQSKAAFNRFFQQELDVTPREYRTQYLKRAPDDVSRAE